MRALFSLLCLFCASPADRADAAFEEARRGRMAEYQTVLSEILADQRASESARGLPEGVREAIEAWTGDA
jgi:hypothetical protein